MSEYPNISKSLWSLALPIADLNSDPANARLHPDRNLDAIKASLHKFGQRKCIVVQKKGMIVRAGNGTMAAAKSLGWTHLACNVIDEDSTDATSFAIADNRTAELAEWDDETLASLLQSLPQECQIAAGFDPDELNELLSKLTPEVVEDTVPEPPASPVSRLGDLWVCGEHRVLCGDSTSAEAVAKVIADPKPSLMVTDPPYGVEYDASKARDGSSAKGKVVNDDNADWSGAWALFPGNIAYVWHADRFCGVVFDSLVSNGFVIRAQIIWAKSSLVFSRGDYHSQHEPCFYAVRGTGNWCGDRTQSTLWQIDKPHKSETGHSTQKPIECMAKPIENNSKVGDAVYDPFLGSGTTLIAAEQLGRKCYGMEISPQYVDVIVTRWEKLTGKQATLEATGKTFADTAAERGIGD